jgi:pyruvate ferredoxin oxidoreductase alpha subunit
VQVNKRVAITGNEAVAEAMRQINPDVVAAYPITPATEIVQIFADSVSNGKVDTEFVTVESEHSAMSATIGASAAGARAMTATSSQGLALMWEMLYIAAGLRLPIVAPIVNRALSAPINIHCDHSDTMGARDSGWIQIYSEDAQEAYDNLIQAMRIAEHPDVLLPTMVTMDGFIVSHGMGNAELLPDDVVKKFVGEYEPEHYLLDVENPITVGALDFSDWYFEHRRQLADAHTRVQDVVLQVAKEFKEISGREYKLFDAYKLDDAEVAIVVINSAAGTAKTVVDQLREKGLKVLADLNNKGIMSLLGISKDVLVQSIIFHDLGKSQPQFEIGQTVDPLDEFEESCAHAERSADIAAHFYQREDDVIWLIKYHHHPESQLPADFPNHLRPMLRLLKLVDGLSAALTRRNGKITLDVDGTKVYVYERNPHPDFDKSRVVDLFTGETREIPDYPDGTG